MGVWTQILAKSKYEIYTDMYKNRNHHIWIHHVSTLVSLKAFELHTSTHDWKYQLTKMTISFCLFFFLDSLVIEKGTGNIMLVSVEYHFFFW